MTSRKSCSQHCPILCGMVVLIAATAGCRPSHEARRQAVENNLRQIEQAIKNYSEQQATTNTAPSAPDDAPKGGDDTDQDFDK